MGLGKPKPLVELKNKPIIIWTLEPFVALDLTRHTVIVVSEGIADQIERLVDQHFGSAVGLKVVPGGMDRQCSVYNGLLVLPPSSETVIVHDAVRPFVEQRSILESIDAAKACGAATVAVPAVDTIAAVSEDGTIRETLDRSGLWAVQTPQTFQYDTILKAHEQAEREGVRATDDAELVRRLGLTVKVVEGSADNIKITTRHDLLVAERILAEREG
jgi:2-C-methyl-D-erythritol 4-phosphate cytidylyltransferase